METVEEDFYTLKNRGCTLCYWDLASEWLVCLSRDVSHSTTTCTKT